MYKRQDKDRDRGANSNSNSHSTATSTSFRAALLRASSPRRASFASSEDEVADADAESDLAYGASSGAGVGADEDEDVCGICRSPFDATCPTPTCLIPGDACPPVWGVCTHAFHMHCIVKWLDAQSAGEERPQCPMCRAEWQMA